MLEDDLAGRLVPGRVDLRRLAGGQDDRLRDEQQRATLTPANSRRAATRSRSAIIAVTSTVMNSVTCGAVNAEATIAAAMCLRTPLIGMRVSRSPGRVRSSLSRRARAGRRRRPATSSRDTVPFGPVAATSARSTPSVLASLRTGGLASTRWRLGASVAAVTRRRRVPTGAGRRRCRARRRGGGNAGRHVERARCCWTAWPGWLRRRRGLAVPSASRCRSRRAPAGGRAARRRKAPVRARRCLVARYRPARRRVGTGSRCRW